MREGGGGAEIRSDNNYTYDLLHLCISSSLFKW